MKIILTGAAGFISSCFLTKLNSMKFDQIYAVDTAQDPSFYETLKGKKIADYLTREDLLTKINTPSFQNIGLVVHLGACSDTTERDKNFLKKNNFEYSRTLAEWCLKSNRIFHYASSASVYGDGKSGYNDSTQETKKFKALNFYAESKLNFDLWVIENNLDIKLVGYRYFNVFGPNEYHKGEMRSMVCKAYDQIKATGKAKLFSSSREGFGDGSEKRDFIYVKDVNEVMAYFIEHPDKKGIFNVGTGKARTFKDLVSAVFSALGKKPEIDWIPMPEKLKGQYQYFTEANLDHLRRAGYSKPFTPLEESIADYVKNHLVKPNPYY
jgi:ADP-L-glycero-D-manno-heptose 6-epimerase